MNPAAKYALISADSHVNPPPDFWRDYLPGRFRDAAPRVEPGDDADYVVFEGNRKPMIVMTGAGGRRPEDYRQTGRKAEANPGGWDASVRLADLDRDGVDAEVLYGGGPLASRDLDLHLASFDAYNRWLADFCAAAPNRLFGIAYLPMYKVEDAIEQMRASARRGLRGVLIPAFPQKSGGGIGIAADATVFALSGDQSGERTYADPEFHPFWEAAIELGMPVHMHLGGRATRHGPKHFFNDMVMSKLTMAEPITIMVMGGVFERYPDLKFVSVESGVGWFAFVANYMDKIWAKHRYWTKNMLKEAPSFYMGRQVYGTFLDDPVGVKLRHEPGAGNIMWSSDYPHSETTFPHSREIVERNFAGVPAVERDWMVCGCARQLYSI